MYFKCLSKTPFLLSAFSMLLLSLQGCGNPEKSKLSEPMTAETPKMMLLDGEWELNYMIGTAGTLQDYFGSIPVVTISSKDNSISGFSGCNQFRGGVLVSGPNLSWKEEFALTRMACPDMDAEQNFLTTLKKVTSYSVTDNGNTLNMIKGDMALMRFHRK